MQIILKPVSHPQLGEIQIKDRLFPIGRHEPPFDAYGAEVVAKLSRRHARIFTQDGSVHIVDLNSLNGTTVNGVPLDRQTRQLQHHDEINFAGLLIYRVCIEQADTTGEDATVVLLTLIPDQRESRIEPIVVADYPYLISKSDGTFARYRDSLPEQYNFLSRRHAHFFLRNHEVMLEDLGSTNGTFVGGQRLDEHARVIHDGDIIAFGGNDFSYRSHLKVLERKGEAPLDEASLLTEALHTSTDADITRTTFVTSANSFIDIFCAEDEEAAEMAEGAASEPGPAYGVKPHRKTAGKAGGSKPKGRAAIFIGEVRRAFQGDDGTGNRRSRWWAVAVMSLVLGLIGLSFLQDAQIRSIEGLIDDEAYARGIAEADAYLREHPDAAAVDELALKAISRQLIPDWKRRLESDEFDAADALLAQTAQRTSHVPSAAPLLEMLHWITDQAAFIEQRGGPDADIRLFQDENRIHALIDWWDRDGTEHQRLASRIAQYEPAFDPVQTRALSRLRSLRNEQSLYLAAIDEMKQALQADLTADDLDGLALRLGEFKAKYPRIAGIDRLEQDLRHYRRIFQTIDQTAWLDALDLLDNGRFLTPPFREQSARLRDERLPPAAIAERYRETENLWRQGQGDAALESLEKLAAGTWGAMAEVELQHKRSVWQQNQDLGDPKEADYPQRLFKLYLALQPDADGYFVQALQADYAQQREQALRKADRALQTTQRLWSEYQDGGRITGLQRLEAKISGRYRKQAERLSQAFKNAQRGADIYRSLNSTPAQAQQSMIQAVLQESRLQHRSLQELNMVLDAKLLQAKLALLPAVD